METDEKKDDPANDFDDVRTIRPHLRQTDDFASLHGHLERRQGAEAGSAREPGLRAHVACVGAGCLHTHQGGGDAEAAQRLTPGGAQPAVALGEIVQPQWIVGRHHDVQSQQALVRQHNSAVRGTFAVRDAGGAAGRGVDGGGLLAGAQVQRRRRRRAPADGRTATRGHAFQQRLGARQCARCSAVIRRQPAGRTAAGP